MQNRRRTRVLRRLVLGFAVAAMVVPAAAQANGADSAQAASFTRSAKYGGIYESNLVATETNVVPGSYGILPVVPSDRHMSVGDYGILPAQPSDAIVQVGDYGVLPAVGGDETILVGHPRGGAQPVTVEWGAVVAGIGGLGLALVALVAFGAVRSTRRVGQPATA